MKNAICLFVFYLLLTASPAKMKGQNNSINCWKAWAQFDRILEEKDTTTALMLYESIKKNNCPVHKNRYLKLSKIAFLIGNVNSSKEYYRKAIEKGIISAVYFDQNFDELIEESKLRYGNKFVNHMLTLNDSLIKINIENNGFIINKLKEIYDNDQKLRKNLAVKKCKSYAFNFKLGLIDKKADNHIELMKCVAEFREKDSIVLEKFISIIDSLGYVPNDDTVFGMLPIGPIINHTSHFQFKGLKEKLLNSVLKGKISPRMFAWWIGYYNEYFEKPPEYFYVENRNFFDNLPEEKIEQINEKRRKIGLDNCPNVIWGSSPY